MVVIGVFIQIKDRLFMTARYMPRAELTRLIKNEIEMWEEGPSFECFMFVAIAFATGLVGGMGVGEIQGGVLELE